MVAGVNGGENEHISARWLSPTVNKDAIQQEIVRKCTYRIYKMNLIEDVRSIPPLQFDTNPAPSRC
jgi:hypothetical protein